MRYVRQNFWQGISFTDLDDLSRQAAVWRDTVANVRIHATTGVQPVARLAEEDLTPLNVRADFDTSMYTSRRVSREATIAFEGNRYSIPWHLAGHDVLVRLLPDQKRLQVLWQDRVVAQHLRAEDTGQFIRDPAHYEGLKRAKAGRPVMVLSDGPAEGMVEQRPLSYYDDLVGVN